MRRYTRLGAGVIVAAAVVFAGAAWVRAGAGQGAAEKGVRLVRDDAKQRVDVYVDGQPFTAYIYPATEKKPVLFPIRTAKGTLVTRGFPLEPRPGERVDHPHHVGLWFNYGDVNGTDFWNNSGAVKPEERPKFGTIVHKTITAVRSGADKGELEADMDWVLADGKGPVVLKEHTIFVFRGGAGWRSVDRITRLEALGDRVALTDNKEGMLGLRVARQLEIPSKKPEVFTDAAGRATTVASMNNEGVNGDYLTSEGQDRRCGVGHARPLVHARREDRRRARDHCHSRPPVEPGVPDGTGTRADTACSPRTISARRRSATAKRN